MRTPEQDVLTWQVFFVYLEDQPREKETGWTAEKLLNNSEEDLFGGRNILNSLTDA